MSAVERALEAAIESVVRRVVREELARMLPARAEYLSPAAAAELAEVAPGTIRRWIRAGHLKAHHAGRAVRIKRDDLERFLAADRQVANNLTPEQLAARDFG